MKDRWLSVAVFLGCVVASFQAEARKTSPATAAPPIAAVPANPEEKKAQDVPPGWRSHCESVGRTEQPTCVTEETAVLTRTGQTVVAFSIRIAADTKTPVALVQIPVGVFLPSGIQLQIDDKTKIDLPLQTCEQRGCFAGTTLTSQFISEMRTSKELKVSFDNLSKQKLTISLPLKGFAQAFEKIE